MDLTNLSNTKKAIIYLRVSTEEQVDNFYLETQGRICTQEAERKRFEVIKIFWEEGRSAKTIIGRQALIQKNLSGVYSDEIFKEQNKLIEDQIASL